MIFHAMVKNNYLDESMERLAEYFKVLSEPNRLVVLKVLKDGEHNVSAVVERTGLSQALVSKHLRLLTIAGLVKRMPEGSLVFYKVVDKGVFKLITQAKKLFLSVHQQQLEALNSTL